MEYKLERKASAFLFFAILMAENGKDTKKVVDLGGFIGYTMLA